MARPPGSIQALLAVVMCGVNLPAKVGRHLGLGWPWPGAISITQGYLTGAVSPTFLGRPPKELPATKTQTRLRESNQNGKKVREQRTDSTDTGHCEKASTPNAKKEVRSPRWPVPLHWQ